MDYNELYHHGVLGMKWGIRRYRNRDGTLTAAGKRRAAQLESKYNAVTGRKMGDGSQSGSTAPRKKNVREMSDDELRSATARLQAERNYLDLQRQVSSFTPQQVSKGRAFINTVGKDVLKPVAIDAGKKLLGDLVKKKGAEMLGLNPTETKDAVGELKKEFTTLNYKKQINELNKYFEAEKKGSPKQQEKPKSESKEKSKAFDPEVEPKRASEPKVTKPKKDSEPIDVDFEDVTEDDYNRGRNYVLRLMQKNK